MNPIFFSINILHSVAINNNRDGGAIVHQTSASLIKGDGIHALACRAVFEFCEDLSKQIFNIHFGRLPTGIPQTSQGKLFRGADWRVEHLHLIYNIYEDNIVDAVLDGSLQGREPELLTVLKEDANSQGMG